MPKQEFIEHEERERMLQGQREKKKKRKREKRKRETEIKRSKVDLMAAVKQFSPKNLLLGFFGSQMQTLPNRQTFLKFL